MACERALVYGSGLSLAVRPAVVFPVILKTLVVLPPPSTSRMRSPSPFLGPLLSANRARKLSSRRGNYSEPGILKRRDSLSAIHHASSLAPRGVLLRRPSEQLLLWRRRRRGRRLWLRKKEEVPGLPCHSILSIGLLTLPHPSPTSPEREIRCCATVPSSRRSSSRCGPAVP